MTQDSRNWFKRRRHELHLTLAAMAHIVGVTPQTILNWESARRAPEPHTAPRLANAYRVDFNEMARQIVRLAVAASRRRPARQSA
jgi:DNA-binding XRE family transcriptional regulator